MKEAKIKKCQGCGNVYPKTEEYFYKQSGRKIKKRWNSYRSRCRVCWIGYVQAKKKKEPIFVMICRNCGSFNIRKERMA